MKPGNTRLTEQDVQEIREMRTAGYLLREIGAKFDIGDTAVSAIAKGQRWKEVGVRDSRIDISQPAAVAGRIAALARRAESKALAEQKRELEAAKHAVDVAREQRRRERDPDVKIYRREKNGFERRMARIIDEAKAEFMESIERAASRPRQGGRPRKEPKSWEL